MQLLELKFQLDDQCKPWLMKIKGDSNFDIKDNTFDDVKAYILSDVFRIMEQKVVGYKHFLRKNPFVDLNDQLKQQLKLGTLDQGRDEFKKLLEEIEK